MNPISLEYRILRALVLGSATISEMALRLSESTRSVDYSSRELTKHKLLRVCGTVRRIGACGKSSYRFELTPEGREWALETMGVKV